MTWSETSVASNEVLSGVGDWNWNSCCIFRPCVAQFQHRLRSLLLSF